MKTIFNIFIGIFIGLIVSGLFYISVRAPEGVPVELLPSATPQPVVVYVTGAVKRPGVYRLPFESRLVDAVQLAGGFTNEANVSQVNLAKLLEDGEQIVISGATDIATPQLMIGGNGLLFTPTPPAGKLVNINIASAEELDQLPGIGPTAAQKIIDFRLANGQFTRIEDLLKVPGIGPSTLDEIRGLVTIGK